MDEDECGQKLHNDICVRDTDGSDQGINQTSDNFATLSLDAADDDKAEIMYAVGDFLGNGNNQLSFKAGDSLKIIQKCSEHWYWAELNGIVGYAPVNHLAPNHTTLHQICWQDDEYFESYGKLKLHHEMLSDKPRTFAYKSAILNNAHLLKDKVILDVGCGTGILSLMCAKHGHPKQVYAVEASDLAVYTKEVVENNGMSDKVTVLHDFVENINMDSPVDLIISEWMGTLLLFEMMIESVLIARDKYLAPYGTMWPSSASLFLMPVSAVDEYQDLIDFWTCQYDFNLSCLKPLALEEFLQKPNHGYILKRKDCLSVEAKLLELNIHQVRVEDLEEIVSHFDFCIDRSGILHGFCTWFQVDFQGLDPSIETTSLNTGPDNEPTHWKQNLFMLDNGLIVEKGDNVQGYAKISRHAEWRRHLRLFICFTHKHSSSGKIASHEKLFYVWR